MTEKQDTTGALVAVGNKAVTRADESVERYETVVTLPPNFQYTVGKRGHERLAITSDGYDYMNRSLGASFFLPDFVPNEVGEMVRNPIHRKDYIYMRMGAIWRNEHGQLVGTTEDLEVDFQMTYQQARLESWASQIALDDLGQPIFGEDGTPLIRLTDDTSGQYPKTAMDKERDALKALMQLRTMGLRYAQTVLRTRLLKVATGIKSLPGNQPAPVNVRIVGWRDQMAPEERVQAAAAALGGMFAKGRPAVEPTLSMEDLRAIEGERDETDLAEALAPREALSDRERYEQAVSQPVPEPPATSTWPPRVTLDASSMSQEEMEEAIAAEYEQMQASVK